MNKKKIIAWFGERNLDPMDFLQGNGLVSDNAVTLDEVADCDLGLCAYLIFSGEMQKLVDGVLV